jgi:hypothetical protein
MTTTVFTGLEKQSEIYRKLIDIDIEYAPLEVAGLWEMKAQLPEKAIAYIQNNIKMMAVGSAAVRAYERINFGGSVCFYKGPKDFLKKKVLLVCFSGNADRMMLPTALFLQFLPDTIYDVLICRDSAKAAYLKGVAGYVDKLSELPDRMAQDLNLADYESTLCMGCSSGAAAALYAGVLLGSRRALSIGGKHPSEYSKSQTPLTLKPGEKCDFDHFVEGQLGVSKTELVCVFGELHQADVIGAQKLKNFLPTCKVWSIKGLDNHDILYSLYGANQLHKFLKIALLK